MKIKINNSLFFDTEKKPLLIAEISGNHSVKHLSDELKQDSNLENIVNSNVLVIDINQ